MAQKAVASKHADPTAVTAEAAPASAAAAPARRGPVITLTPQAIASIRDDTIRAAKLKEVALRAELANLRGAQRTAMQEKDQAMRKIQGPKSDPTLDKLDVDWSQCMSERDTLNRKLDALKLEQAQISRMRDELRGCDLEMENATQLVRQQDRHFVQCRQAVAESSAKRDEILHALVFKSAGEADDEINRLEQKIAAATRKGETNLVRELNKQRAAADKAKRLVTQSYSADDDVIKKKEEFAKAEQALNEAIEKRKAIDEKRNAMRDKVFGNKNFNADFRAVNDQLDALRKKMDTIKEKKRNGQKKADADRTESSGVKDAVAALDEARSRLTQVLKELDEIAETVPHIEVTFPAELRGEIIGRGGATLDQLRADFGVAVEFTPERVNCLTIVGARPDCEDTKAALSEMMKNLELCRKTATVTFEPSIAASLIGSRGSNVERIQNISGAKIRVSSSDGTATIVGTQEAVDTAKAMIEQHIDQSASIEIPFHKDVRDLVLGKAGATVRRIEEESGAKKIRVDRDRGIISAFGSKAAVEKVKALYGELLADFSAAGFTMRVDQRMLGVIIGKGGSTVQEIQSSTGCIVTIADAGTVTLRGSKDAIQNARRKIEDLTRRDEVRIPYNRAVHELLITRPLITADGGASGETVQQEEKNSPIEEVREVSGCDLVTCLRVEGVILIRGRKEQVSQAKKMLEELLDTLRPDTAVVAFPEVLFNHLTRRTGADKLSILDRIKLEFPSVIAIDIVRSTGQITVAGDKPGVTAASEKLQSLFSDAAASIGTFTTTQSGAGAIIGQGGSKIKELERLHKVDINVSKTNLVTVYAHAGKDALATALAEVEKVAKAAR